MASKAWLAPAMNDLRTELLPASTAARRRMAVFAVIISVSVFALTQGLTYPLLALILDAMGESRVMIGASTAMTLLAMLITAGLVPRLAGRFGAWNLAVAGILGAVGCFVSIGFLREPLLWLPLRFLLGACITVTYVISEMWINQLADAGSRGRLIGIYGTVNAACFALGPLIVTVTGAQSWAPFAIGTVMALSALLPLLISRRDLPAVRYKNPTSIVSFVRYAPVLFLTVLVFAAFDQIALSLMPIYAIDHGLSAATGTFVLSLLTIGNVGLQYPAGWLADKLTAPRLVRIVAFVAAIGALLLPLVAGSAIGLSIHCFIWGGVVGVLYTLTLIELGRNFQGDLLLAGNAAFTVAWGLGGVLGPPLGGAAMQLFGHAGLPAVLFLVFGGLNLAWCSARMRRYATATIFQRGAGD
jgi:MFS family permease